MITNTDGSIQDGYKINDNKVIMMKVCDSPSFQFSITQVFLDIKENDRLTAEGLPPVQASSIMVTLTYSELCVVYKFISEYLKDYYKANQLMVAPVATR
jgi:hypothetical protein